MTQVGKPKQNVFEGHALTDDELAAVSGGFSAMEDVKAESQRQQTLSSMVSDVIKNF
jgi:bacteriocin-like protein